MSNIENEINWDTEPEGWAPEPEEQEKPDWRFPKSYNYLSDYNTAGWGWEFLRRNLEYQQDWHKALKIYYREKDFPSETEHPQSLLGDAQAYKKWGIMEYIRPECRMPATFEFDITSLRFIAGKVHPLYEKSCNIDDFIESGELAVIIDLGLPIEPQLEAITPYLQTLRKLPEIKKKRPTHHISCWTKYLRILDACAEGVNRGDAALKIFPKLDKEEAISSWDESLKQANNMVKSGFKELLKSPPAINDPK